MPCILKKEKADETMEQTSSRRKLPQVRKISSSQNEKLLQEVEEEVREQRHDINNLITVIMGTVELTKSSLIQGGLTHDDLLKALKDIEHITTMIKKLTASPLASLERAKNNIELNAESINVLSICEQIQSLFPGTHIAIKPKTAKTVIEADHSMILRVLYNIVHNAIKFSENKRAPVIITIDDESDKYLVVSVTDFGPGLERDNEKLFESGYRSTSTSHLEGSGLGLAFCKKAVTYHKGEITAENNENGFGATFTVKLPYKLTHNQNDTRIK